MERASLVWQLTTSDTYVGAVGGLGGKFEPELAMFFGNEAMWCWARPSKRKVKGDDEKDEMRKGFSPGSDKT